MSIKRWMDKEDVRHIYNGILLSHKKEWNNTICSNMDGTGDYHKWSKSERERQRPYYSVCAFMLSHICHAQFCVTLWTVICLAPRAMGFCRQEYWSVCHALLLEIFLTQGSNPCLLCLLQWQAGSFFFFFFIYFYYLEANYFKVL